MSEIILLIDDLRSYNSSCVTSMCRICHEAEFESCKPLETPCACSGTLKFAHRDCVQRWCNEKGNTVCEICLQKFESGYTSPPPKKTQLIDATVTIRGSLEVPRNDEEEEEENRGGEIIEREYSECESAAGERSSCCKSVALIFTALLLIRHLLGVISGGAGGAYPFSLLTVLIVKASGIVLPMYILTRVIVALQTTITHHYHNTDTYTSSDDDDEEDEEDEEAA